MKNQALNGSFIIHKNTKKYGKEGRSMEKVRYGGVVFDLVPGGFDTLSAKEQVIIKHQMGNKSLAEIKAIAKAATGSLDLLDEDGGLIRSMDGYVYGGDIREVENYLVEEKQVPITSTASAETDSEASQASNQSSEPVGNSGLDDESGAGM